MINELTKKLKAQGIKVYVSLNPCDNRYYVARPPNPEPRQFATADAVVVYLKSLGE